MSCIVIDEKNQKKPISASPDELRRMLKVIENEVLPKTVEGVENGNKVFGAAILDDKFDTVLTETNAETKCPIFHGEVHLIYNWSQMTPASQRGPMAQSSVFLSTHEPCCMCISSILWAGFPTVYYFFPYSITSEQGIPHDIQTMHELWGVPSYRKQNKYMSTACIMELIDNLEESDEKKELVATQQRLIDEYDKLSKKYHTGKTENADNSLVLG